MPNVGASCVSVTVVVVDADAVVATILVGPPTDETVVEAGMPVPLILMPGCMEALYTDKTIEVELVVWPARAW